MTNIPTNQELWQQYRVTKSERIRNQIADLNDKLALSITHRMKGYSAETIEDLSQIARIGLLKAIEGFDPDLGVAFSSFAVPYIRGEILHFFRDHFGSVKIPRRIFEEVAMVRRICRDLERLGRKPNPVAVAEACGIPAEKWEWISEAAQRKQLADIDDQHELAGEDEIESIERQHEHQKLKIAIARLPRLKRICVEEYWVKGVSAATIARRHKMELQQVQNLLDEALEQLKLQLVGV